MKLTQLLVGLVFVLVACSSSSLGLNIEPAPEEALQTAFDRYDYLLGNFANRFPDSRAYNPDEFEIVGSQQLNLDSDDAERNVTEQWCIVVRSLIGSGYTRRIGYGTFLVSRGEKGWSARQMAVRVETNTVEGHTIDLWEHCLNQ